MQLNTLFGSSEFPPSSKLPGRLHSPISCVDQTPRPHETSEASKVRRIGRGHLGNGIRVTKDIIQTVHVIPQSPRSGPSSVDHSFSPISNQHESCSTISATSSMQILPSSTIKPVLEDEESCPSPVVRTQRASSPRKPRPRSALLLSQNPTFEESPDFAALYNVDQASIDQRPVTRHSRSTSEERTQRLDRLKPVPRDARPEIGNTKDLILFLQSKSVSLTPESIVSAQPVLADSPRTTNAVSSFRTASNKFSQFVHPRAGPLVHSATTEDIGNRRQKKPKAVTKFYASKRINSRLKKSVMDVRGRMTPTDVVNKEGNFEGLVDLNAAENNAPPRASYSTADEEDNKTNHGTEETQAERWEMWNRYVGRFGSAEKFTEEVTAAMTGGVDDGRKLAAGTHVPKHEPQDEIKSPNLRQGDNNASNSSATGLDPSYPEGKAVLTVYNAPRRKGGPISSSQQASNVQSQQDLQHPTIINANSELPKYRYNKESNNETVSDHATNSSGPAGPNGPAILPIPPGPRISSRSSSRMSNATSRQIGLFPSPSSQGKPPASKLSNEDFVPRRNVAEDLHLASSDGPSVSTSTLSVIESQAILHSPLLPPSSSDPSTVEPSHLSPRAQTPVHYQPKTRAPTDPPMGPLPELPEGHDRSDIPSSSSYRSKRSSRHSQPIHGRNNSSLASISVSRAASPSHSYNLQDSPSQSTSARNTIDRSNAPSQIDTRSSLPMSIGTSRDLRSPTSVRSMDSVVSAASHNTRADRVRARKLRDTASIRARNENRALEEREANAKSSNLSEDSSSPNLDQFPSIPLPISNQNATGSLAQANVRSALPRHRSSFRRNSSLNVRQTLSRSPIFIVADSDPHTSKFRTACRSPSTTPTSAAFGKDVAGLGRGREINPPVRTKKSERSIHSKKSITRNGTHTPPRSESSTSSDEDRSASNKLNQGPSPAPRLHSHNKSSREDLLEQRVQRLEMENKKYLAMIVAWLDPERVLNREISTRSYATTATALTASTTPTKPYDTTTNTSVVGSLPSALHLATKEVNRPDSYQSTSTGGISNISDGRAERVLADQIEFFGGASAAAAAALAVASGSMTTSSSSTTKTRANTTMR